MSIDFVSAFMRILFTITFLGLFVCLILCVAKIIYYLFKLIKNILTKTNNK